MPPAKTVYTLQNDERENFVDADLESQYNSILEQYERAKRGDIGYEIRALRQQRGLTLELLAKKLMVSIGDITRCESGICVPLPLMISRLCKFFHKSPEIFTWDRLDEVDWT